MKLRSLAPAAVLFLAAAVSQAQVGVGLYMNPFATRISNSRADTGPFSFLGTNTTSRMFWGFQMGAYYDYFHAGSLSAGPTMRFSDQHANNASIRDFQVGARVSDAITPRLRPYIEVTVGDGSTKPPKASVRINKAAYAVYGGADYQLAKHVDVRVFEIGYGSVTTASSSTVGQGNGASYPASTLLSFSSGFVFKF